MTPAAITGALILWSHALAALAFAVGAWAAWRRSDAAARRAFAAALLLSALWSLSVAGIDARDLATRLAEAARNLAWLGFMLILVRRARAGGWALTAVYVVVAAVLVTGAALAVGEAAARGARVQETLAIARLLFRMMAAAGALVLVRHLHRAAAGGVRLIATALALMWGVDLLLSSVAYASGAWPPALMVGRGLAAVVVALLMGAAAQRRDRWTLALSRPAAMRTMSAVALVIYGGGAVALAGLAREWGGDHARALQAGVAVGATAALLALLSSSWLGAWAKVKLAKHLFRHRYDYRTEWQRFTDRLGGGSRPLEERVAQAVAELLDAPAGLLLNPDGTHTGWRWERTPEPLSPELGAWLAATRRILELDGDDDRERIPDWMRADPEAWALVPLLHGEALAGAVLLARPPVARALDWEDFDLLRVAGRQAASYLAEDRAGRALAEAQRFDEFHRRFAFVLHDIKNLVSQQQLVARNAERHGADPAFRADMIATLNHSAERMTGLIARLSQAEPSPAEPLAAVDLAALAARMAAQRRAQHPIRVEAGAPCWASAHPQRLEQVLGHLLQNAMEASAPGGPVALIVRSEDSRAVLEVVDRGAGMTAAFVRDALFRPFSSTKPGGFGVGAFEARQLVTAMGGTLSVESAPGVGTRFRIVLPAAPALEQAA